MNLFPPEFIPCLSMHQPWAQWVMFGWKPIETRLHDRFRSLEGEDIGIHAAQKWDESAIYSAYAHLSEGQREIKITHLNAGALIAVAHVDTFRPLTREDAPRALIECNTPRYGLILSNIRPLSIPLPMKGQQGIWKIRNPFYEPT